MEGRVSDLINNTSSSSGSGGHGNFPQGQGQVSATDIATLNHAYPTIGQWFAARGITSTEQPFYMTNGKLNANAFELEQFYTSPEADRLSLQEDLVAAGLLTPADANGLPNSTAIAAFRAAQQNAMSLGLNVDSYLQQQGTGTNAIENQLASSTATLEKQATAPVTASLENPTTLAQALSSAVDQTLGYTPANMQTLINQFVSQIHGQDIANAEAPRTTAKDELAQIHSEQSALNKLGPDGIDSVIQAYQNAVHGLPGGPQGPQVGMAGAGQVTGGGIGISPPPTYTTSTAPAQQGFLGAVEHNVGNFVRNPLGAIEGQGNQQMGQNVGTRQVTTPNIPPGRISPLTYSKAVPVYGGEFALSPAQWKKAQSLFSPAKKYSSAGQAPQEIQRAAFTALLSQQYDSNGGSWSKAVQSVASGSPLGKAKGAGLQAFATGVASQVNNEITNLQNQVNNATVTTKVTAPDAQAEALAAAKAADPVGYYAANYGSWGDELSKMLYGSPLSTIQSTADTFTGPVGATSAVGTPATAAAPAPTAPAGVK